MMDERELCDLLKDAERVIQNSPQHDYGQESRNADDVLRRARRAREELELKMMPR